MNIAASAPSSARSLTSLAYERLRDDILRGRLAPSERLRIQALSERYQIGATAIREALSRLTTDGLVEAEDQRGFTVASVSREELLDLTQTRIEIEQMALRMAVANGDVEWESHIVSSFHRLSRAEAQPWTEETLAAWASGASPVPRRLGRGLRIAVDAAPVPASVRPDRALPQPVGATSQEAQARRRQGAPGS